MIISYDNPHILEEIEKANLKTGEDEELEAKREIILNSEKINENLNIADLEISEKAIIPV